MKQPSSEKVSYCNWPLRITMCQPDVVKEPPQNLEKISMFKCVAQPPQKMTSKNHHNHRGT